MSWNDTQVVSLISSSIAQSVDASVSAVFVVNDEHTDRELGYRTPGELGVWGIACLDWPRLLTLLADWLKKVEVSLSISVVVVVAVEQVDKRRSLDGKRVDFLKL